MDVELLPLLALLAAAVLAAATPARGADMSEAFHVEWGPPDESFTDAVVRGWVANGSTVHVSDVRLCVDTLDGDGPVVGRSYGWVIGDVPAGGRGWFVESWDETTVTTTGDGAASPPSR